MWVARADSLAAGIPLRRRASRRWMRKRQWMMDLATISLSENGVMITNEIFMKQRSALEFADIVLIVILTITNMIAWKLWIRERSNALKLDHDLKMSRLETERMVILARAVSSKSCGSDPE